MKVEVYGGDHSPWVNAVLLALYERFSDYPHLYSGAYFEPHLPQPVPQGLVQRAIFYLGFLMMVALIPVTLPLVFVLMRKAPR